MTPMTGGEGLKARWSIVKVATVPATSARRSACIWSMAWHERQARVGGMWRNPHTVHRLAAKPYFHPSERWTVGAPGRSGSGRRGGSRTS